MIDGIFRPVKRIVAIGDIHGDFESLKIILLKSNVINSNNAWIGGGTYVVQVGDQLDGLTRVGKWCGDNDFEVLLYLTELDAQAKKSGGRVLNLIGNHELNNTLGDLSYVSKNGITQLGGSNERRALCAPRGKIAQLFAHSRYAIIKVGDWVFVHGGVVPDIAKTYTIPRMNNLMRKYMVGGLSSEEQPHFNRVFMNENSIVYYRGFSNVRPNCDVLKESVKYFGGANMVVGHTVQDKINCKCVGTGTRNIINGSVWRVDTGISRGFGEDNLPRLHALEIIDNIKVRII
jgi:hypothetical protein